MDDQNTSDVENEDQDQGEGVSLGALTDDGENDGDESIHDPEYDQGFDDSAAGAKPQETKKKDELGPATPKDEGKEDPKGEPGDKPEDKSKDDAKPDADATPEETSAAERVEQEYVRQMAERGTPVAEPQPSKSEPAKPEPAAVKTETSATDGITLPAKFKVGEVEVDLAEVERDFPEAAAIAGAIKAGAEKVLAKQRDEIEALRAQFAEYQTERVVLRFWRNVESKHPGAEALVQTQPFKDWIGTQKESTKFLYQQGAEAGADAVLTLYKAHVAATAATGVDAKNKAKLDRQTKLHTGTGGVKARDASARRKTPDELRDDGFELAAKEK